VKKEVILNVFKNIGVGGYLIVYRIEVECLVAIFIFFKKFFEKGCFATSKDT